MLSLLDSLVDLTESFSTAIVGGAHTAGLASTASTVFNTVSAKPQKKAPAPNIYKPLSPVINLAPLGLLIR